VIGRARHRAEWAHRPRRIARWSTGDLPRIGNTSARDHPTGSREFAVWCSQRDAARGIARAIDAPAGVRYDICFITSDNRWGYRDLAHSREVLGYVPQDRAEDHR